MARPKTGRTVIAKNLTLRPVDWATIDAHAKDCGLLSRSAGLRSILAEWKGMAESLNRDAANLELARLYAGAEAEAAE